MKDNDEMMDTNDTIRQELLEVLNKISSNFSEVLQKHGMVEDKTLIIEFKVFDKTQLEIDNTSEENVRFLPTSLPPKLLNRLTWCPPSLCPPSGKFF